MREDDQIIKLINIQNAIKEHIGVAPIKDGIWNISFTHSVGSTGHVCITTVLTLIVNSTVVCAKEATIGLLSDARIKELAYALQTAVLQAYESKASSFAVFSLIHAERQSQDAVWGGPQHDDTHNLSDWYHFIKKQLCYMRNEALDHGGLNISTGEFSVSKNFVEETALKAVKKRLIKIAALAVAAHKSLERTGRL